MLIGVKANWRGQLDQQNWPVWVESMVWTFRFRREGLVKALGAGRFESAGYAQGNDCRGSGKGPGFPWLANLARRFALPDRFFLTTSSVNIGFFRIRGQGLLYQTTKHF